MPSHGPTIAAALIVILFAIVILCLPGSAQVAAQAQETAGTPVSDRLQPAIMALTQAVRELRIEKWKAPTQVRDDAARNVASIDRDLDGTLPQLLAAADQISAPAAGGQPARSTAASFAVYRNLDALYDVALRVSLTAELAAPDVEVEALGHALSRLEAARKDLGDSIFDQVNAQQQTLARAQADLVTARAAVQAQAAPAKVNVVDDGPAPAAKKSTAKKKKAAAQTQNQPQ